MLFKQGQKLERDYPWRIIDYCWGVFPALASICLFMALWQYAHQVLGAMLMPSPQTVLARAYEILYSHAGQQTVLTTLARGAVGIALALFIGIGGGLLAGVSKTLALLLRPLITMLLGTPPIIWVVLALFWFGMGFASTVFTVMISVLPMVFAAAMMGMMSVSEPLKEMLRIYRLPLTQRIRHLYVPHLTQQLLPAIIVAFGTGLKITVMAELLGSNEGIGSELANARAMLETTDVMAYVVIIVSIIMLIEYGVLEPLKRLLLPQRST
ncbi:ABC transporter permease subunit [Suttonella sp. R2A3]|uniref:ABC transporter permease n=1 Tax=Suttonella sp. R2A3 TaxID=2908648 RepID=UPI001F1DCB6D|nr:ABC transporter permease subunit [Suttonella sp. R2A3]UJF23953.1 ABC transporter permease subunit [Suttonella sp. R2A3]